MLLQLNTPARILNHTKRKEYNPKRVDCLESCCYCSVWLHCFLWTTLPIRNASCRNYTDLYLSWLINQEIQVDKIKYDWFKQRFVQSDQGFDIKYDGFEWRFDQFKQSYQQPASWYENQKVVPNYFQRPMGLKRIETKCCRFRETTLTARGWSHCTSFREYRKSLFHNRYSLVWQ